MNYLTVFTRSLGNRLNRGENFLSISAFFIMAFLPVVEAVARLFGSPGVPASSVIVQHMTLWISFLGAVLAARQNKLLSLTGPQTPGKKEKIKVFRWLSSLISISVVIALAFASLHLVIIEAEYPRNVLPGVPIWVMQAIMPVGFGLIAYQIFSHSLMDKLLRTSMIVIMIIELIIGVSFILMNVVPDSLINFPFLEQLISGLVDSLGAIGSSSFFLLVGIIGIILALVFGAPIFIGLGGVAVLLFLHSEVPIAAIPTETYRIVVSPTLPTIPLFTLAGYILAEGGASRRLIKVFRAWFGWIPGGTPVMVTLLCGFFTALTGGSGVTILALGGLLLPMLLAEKYPLKFSIGLITVSGSLGLLFPPSLPAIIYGVTAGVPINHIFLAGIVPGFLLIFFIAFWGVRQGYVSQVRKTKFELKKAMKVFWEAKWEVFLPILILTGIFGGFTTLVEVAAFVVIYVLIIETFVYKDLKLRSIPGIVLNCATLVGGVLIILGVAMGLTSYLVDAQVPMLALSWAKTNIHSTFTFLLTLNVFLLIVGSLMDIFSAIIVVVPLIVPIGIHFGVDPVHLAIIFIANMELGFITPPVGMNLFLSAYRFDKSMPEVYKSTLPFFVIRLIGVLAITYLPILSLGLLSLLSK